MIRRWLRLVGGARRRGRVVGPVSAGRSDHRHHNFAWWGSE